MNITGEYLRISETTFKKLKQNKKKGLKVVDSLILSTNQIIITYIDNTLSKTTYIMGEFTINDTVYQLNHINTAVYRVCIKKIK